jgi:hypothetical protein
MQPDAAWPASPAAVAVTRSRVANILRRSEVMIRSGTNEFVWVRDDGGGGGIYVR